MCKPYLKNIPWLPLFVVSFFCLSSLHCSSVPTENTAPGLTARPSNTTCLATTGDPPAENLADTGCVSPQDATQGAAGLIPYDVNVPLWSDGALKERWMGVPDGEGVVIGPDGKWIFPVGTVLVKNFWVDGQLIETRLFMQHQAEQWGGYTYEWNEAVTEAHLVQLTGKLRTLGNGQTWFYPSRNQCLRCHTPAAGWVLGPETANLNRLFNYPQTSITANQITTLAHIGLLEGVSDPPVADWPQFPPWRVGPHSTAENTALARAYLHVNCANCHRPGGPGMGPEDFRYTTPLADMGACEVLPTLGDLGIPGTRLLAPGDPNKSIFWLRMASTGPERMPPLATALVDDLGLEIIADWVQFLTSCQED